MGLLSNECFAEIMFDSTNVGAYDRKRQARDTAVSAYIPRLNVFGKTCARIFLEPENADVPFVHHSDEVKYMSRLRNCLQKETDTETLELLCWCLCKPSDSNYLVRDTKTYERELDLVVCQRTKDQGFFLDGTISIFCCAARK